MQASPVSNRNGVIAVLTKAERKYYTVEDVMELLGVKQSKAYQIIRSLRDELISSGKLLEEYPVGRIPKKYFDTRCGTDLEV